MVGALLGLSLNNPMTAVALNTDKWIRQAHAEAWQSAARYELLGLYRITYYCSCDKCCGKADGITASGTKATEGRTVAADLPLGTHILIDGHEYVVEDTGSAIKGKRIDIYLDSHAECLARGVDYKTVVLER